MTAKEFARYTWDAAARITGITQDLWGSLLPSPNHSSSDTYSVRDTTGSANLVRN